MQHKRPIDDFASGDPQREFAQVVEPSARPGDQRFADPFGLGRRLAGIVADEKADSRHNGRDALRLAP
ncbi:hypothetical protein D3C83_214520 [compost metagenome]